MIIELIFIYIFLFLNISQVKEQRDDERLEEGPNNKKEKSKIWQLIKSSLLGFTCRTNSFSNYI